MPSEVRGLAELSYALPPTLRLTYEVHQFENASVRIFKGLIGSISTAVIVLQAFYTIKEEQVHRGLSFYFYGVGICSQFETERL